MLSCIKRSWDQTGKQDWGNVFDMRDKQSLTLFKSDCWCIKKICALKVAAGIQPRTPQYSLQSRFLNRGTTSTSQLQVLRKFMEKKQTETALLQPKARTKHSIELKMFQLEQDVSSFGISTTHWLEISFQDGGQAVTVCGFLNCMTSLSKETSKPALSECTIRNLHCLNAQ